MLEQSTLTSGIIAILMTATVCYCAVAQIPLPEYLYVALGSIIGFFFSSKISDAKQRAAMQALIECDGKQ